MSTVLERNFKISGNLASIYKPGDIELVKFIQGLEVRLLHKAPLEIIFLGSALTDNSGNFSIEFAVDSPVSYVVDGKIRNTFLEVYYNGIKLELEALPSLIDGLVAYWKLDETSGLTATDATGNGHEGTLSGSTLPDWAPGKINNGLMINGGTNGLQESYLLVPDSTDFDFGTGDFTFAFWMQPNNDALYFAPVDTGFDDAGSFSLLYATSEDEFRIYSSAVNVYTKPCVLVISDWCHVVVRRISGVIDVCVNGASLGTEPLTDAISVTRGLAFGSWRQSGQSVDGVMDEIGVWKGHGLDDAQVMQLYNGGDGLQYPFID